jgi:hypothetical protein
MGTSESSTGAMGAGAHYPRIVYTDLNGLFQIPPDLVVKFQAIDIAEIILPRIGRPNAAQALCRNRISSFEQPFTSEAYWSTTKSDGMWIFQIPPDLVVNF